MEFNEGAGNQFAVVPPTGRRARRWAAVAVMAVTLLLVAGLAIGGVMFRAPTSASAPRNPAYVDQLVPLYVMEEPGHFVTDLAFSPDGHTLASATNGNHLSLWRVSDGSLQRRLPFPGMGENDSPFAEMQSVAFSPDGQTLACGTGFGEILQWRASDWSPLPTLYAKYTHI